MTKRSSVSDQEHWDLVYNRLYLEKPIYDLWLDAYEPFLAGTKNDAIIDLGCGYGCDTLYLTERGYRVIACDFSEMALSRIAEHIPEAETRQIDMTEGLPFAGGSAGAVVADLSLHYFAWQDTVNIVNDIDRVLKAQGVLLARFNSVGDIHYGAGLGLELEPNYYEHDGRRKRFFDERDLLLLFADWEIKSIRETDLYRYSKPKRCWELVAVKV
ncbi:class I SAM-dependent methyltransferase [Paenibacillus glycinis]|uniref:Methyltransferase domain-containing protein n=1 Tax=Paenibacillus glycinis TaxID=2697035 RepID=A0ABW9XSA2_9BACL|nr:class I SAM-dependent methyltransferase [Paenibacillus glycinis]NBD25539.1 methyltransferase domain-containing protein [Paenibacillus glycinis]